MDIRAAAVRDAESILALQKLCYQTEAELYNDYRIPPLVQTVEQLTAELTSIVVLKATDNDVIIGSVRARSGSETCQIGRLIVHPDHQNLGIGKLLMAAIEREFPTVQRFELFTGDRSQKNIAFYGRLGYREFKREALTDSVKLVYMEKYRRVHQDLQSLQGPNVQ